MNELIDELKLAIARGDGDRSIVGTYHNQVQIMRAMIVLLEKANECGQCGGTGWMVETVEDSYSLINMSRITRDVPCDKCNADAKRARSAALIGMG